MCALLGIGLFAWDIAGARVRQDFYARQAEVLLLFDGFFVVGGGNTMPFLAACCEVHNGKMQLAAHNRDVWQEPHVHLVVVDFTCSVPFTASMSQMRWSLELILDKNMDDRLGTSCSIGSADIGSIVGSMHC